MCTNFTKIYEPLQNYRRDDVKQAAYCGPANIRRYHIKVSVAMVPWSPVFVHPWFKLLRAI
jgi:hypothetical protein